MQQMRLRSYPMEGISSPPLLALLLLSFLAASARCDSFLETLPEVSYGVSIRDGDSVYCESWKFSVEVNDAGIWKTIPIRCLGYVAEYINGPRYAADCDVVADESIEYARLLPISGKEAWIFDVDETLLSNLPYYRVNGYGSELFNETSFDAWVDLAEALAIPGSLRLYRELQQLGVTLIILTGRSEHQRDATEKNLRAAGYSGWERVILRQKSDQGTKAELYKSQRRAALESEGFKIVGNSGDQWSDLTGAPIASRSFKLPNPMYVLA